MNALEIIERYLKENEFDGLFNDAEGKECCCLRGEISCINNNCKPGYKHIPDFTYTPIIKATPPENYIKCPYCREFRSPRIISFDAYDVNWCSNCGMKYVLREDET